MSRQTLRDLFIILCVAAALGWVLSFLPWRKYFSRIPELALSIENEVKLGNMLADNILQSMPVTDSVQGPMDSALVIISERLLSKLSTSPYHYKIKLVKGEEINAFNIPGGRVFVFSGLLKFADTPEEVAAVLAHEIGHGEKRHGVFKMIKEVGITVVLTLITGGDPGIIGSLGRMAASTMFDREQEREADDFALKLLESAGIHPSNVAGFFKKLSKESGDYDKFSELFMTHPNHESRIANAMNYKTGKNFKQIPFELDWGRVKSNFVSKK